MKKMKKSIKNLAFLLLAGLTFCFAACKTESDDTTPTDTTALASVTNLVATAKGGTIFKVCYFPIHPPTSFFTASASF